jgi:hypothetical protein
MRKVALLVLALELAVCGCGSNNNSSNTITTSTSGNWEAQFTGGGSFPAAQMNFVASFDVTSTTGGSAQPLTLKGFSVFNASQCFGTGTNAETESGSATLNTSSAGAVTGSLTITVTSNATSTASAGNVLTLNTDPDGGFSGTSNGTTSTTGTLTNGIAWGTWSLQSSDSNCTGGAASPITGTFVMCQGKSTCTPP